MNTDSVAVKKKANVRYVVTSVVIFALLLFYAIILFAPFYVIFDYSITSNSELSSTFGFRWFPESVSFEGYQMVFAEDPWSDGIPTLVTGFFNTMWQTLLPLVVGLLVSGFSAFCFAKLRFPGKEKIFLLHIATMTMPVGVFGTVGYFFWQALGLSETVIPLVLPGMFGGAGTVFFLRMYFESIGNEIMEAAKIDGAGIFRIYFSMVIPLALPAFLTQFIFGFVGGYNSYVGPLLYLIGSPSQWPLQLVLSQILGIYSTGNLNTICAAALMCMLPLVIMYIFLQKWFLEGIAVGGGKE